MLARDPHRFVNELDESAHQRLIARLEARAQNAPFTALFEKYLDKLDFHPGIRILEVGCGTGAMLRLLARRPDFCGTAVGVDQCPSFIRTASERALAEEISDRLRFQLGDVHRLDFPPADFDVVIAHTLISHVTDPARVLGEMARVVRTGGTLVVFDGDYASLTYAFPDHGFGQRMDSALATATFNNPRIMRDLPRLLPELGLKLIAAWGDAVVEIGEADYFKSFADTYAPYVKQAGLLPGKAVDIWLEEQTHAMNNGTFFAACNYYTYLVRRS